MMALLLSPAQAASWEENVQAGEAAIKNHHVHKAEQALLLALKEAEAFGDDDVRLARTLDDLGKVFNHERRNKEAELYFKRSLAIREKKQGADHPDVAMVLNELGTVYKDEHKYQEAETEYKRALDIYKRKDGNGEEDQYIAVTFNNLGRLYLAANRTEEAIPLLAQAIAFGDKSLGEDNEHVVDTVGKLASVYDNQGKTDKARPLFRRYLNHVRKAMGLPNHNDPKSLDEIKELAKCLRSDNDVKAADLLEKAIKYETDGKP
ncbi:MAG TPA: tetratricopeptide repeat protein [Nitrososphaera sp.]|nr:tetratricopeptide repeat protein [Nitrososphaera sp.]